MRATNIPYQSKCSSNEGSLKHPRIKPGDTVGIVSTSLSIWIGGKDEETLKKEIIQLFSEFGLNVKFAKYWASKKDPLYSGTPEERRSDLMQMFTDPSVDLIMASKGGGGAIDVVPLLDYDIIKMHQKPYIGFSDPTFVHMALQSRINMLTMYSPNAIMTWTESMKKWFSCILMQGKKMTFSNPGTETIVRGKAIGRLLGGVFELIFVTPWTGYGYNLDDPYILFFEAIGVSDEVLERRLKAMDRGGLFKNAKGLVFGECPRCPGGNPVVNAFVKKIWRKYPHVPSYTGANVTHGHDGSFTLPMNILYEIDSGKGQLKMLESFVKEEC